MEKVNESQLVKLEGNTPPAAIAQNDRGRVSSSMPMADLTLVLRRSPEQQADFDAFVESQYDVTSPNYHRWLTPDEIGAKFGPASADLATISSWLASHGLSVNGVSKDRMTIQFSGSAAQVEETFHTEIHNLVVRGESHISNMSDPQIPMALEPVVAGPKALHNFTPRPLHKLGGKVELNPETGKWQPLQNGPLQDVSGNAGSARPRPDLGIPTGSGTSSDLFEFVTPYDFATIYNVLPLWNAGSPIDGTGQTIAIAGTSNINLADVASFRSIFGLPASTPTVTYTGGGTAPIPCTGSTGLCTLDDQTENALDVEWSGAVAKGAKIVLVFTTPTSTNDPVYLSANYIIQNSIAPILNVSYGECELGLGTTGNTAYNTLWQTASAAGIAVFVASGDSGSPACDQGQSATTPYSANFGLSVSGIASTQFNTAVGGTDFQWCNPTATANCTSGSPYWSSTNGASTGANALGYIPEVPWNDTCTTPVGITYITSVAAIAGGGTVTNAESACNYIFNNYVAINNKYNADLSFFVNVEGGGGGASNCTTSNGSTVTSCAGGYAKPSWQTGVSGIPGDGKRDIPDVSFFAASGLWNSAYMMCISAAGSCLASTSPASPPVGQEVGGTSAASPAMAGVMALINQKAGGPQGNPNAGLYQLAGKQTYASCKSEGGSTSNGCYFNDIDTSTNAMPCTAGSPNCTVATSGDAIGVLSGFNAGVGYDAATGLGSLNVANVVNAWPVTIGTATATVSVSASPSTITSGQGTTVTVTVTGGSGTPTGTVILTSGGFTSATKTLTGGTVAISVTAGQLAVGADTVKASYSGDGTYAAASSTTTVTVTPLPTPTVTVTPASGSINSGQSLNVIAAVAGTGGTPTGTVTLSGGGYTSSAQTLASGSATIAIPANSLGAGTDTLTVTYGGDNNFATATGTASVTVTQSTYALAATTPANITRGSSAASTVTWTTSNNYSANVALSTCTLNAGSPANSSGDTPRCTVGTTAFGSSGSATATVSTTAATTAALKRPVFPGMAATGSGAILALVAFFGIPARRRSWRVMLGMFLLLMTLGSLAACGGGGSSGGGGGGGTSDPGTASGKYVFTVNATGADPAKTTATTTFTVTVN